MHYGLFSCAVLGIVKSLNLCVDLRTNYLRLVCCHFAFLSQRFHQGHILSLLEQLLLAFVKVVLKYVLRLASLGLLIDLLFKRHLRFTRLFQRFSKWIFFVTLR